MSAPGTVEIETNIATVDEDGHTEAIPARSAPTVDEAVLLAAQEIVTRATQAEKVAVDPDYTYRGRSEFSYNAAIGIFVPK